MSICVIYVNIHIIYSQLPISRTRKRPGYPTYPRFRITCK